MKYIIGVDGGGTKTEAVAYDFQGNIIVTSVKGFANLLNNREKALNNIVDSIREIIDVLKEDELVDLYLGIAGSEVGDNAKIIKDTIKNELKTDCVLMNDAEIALKAMLRGNDGILTIAGTGSIAFGVKNNSSVRCGGWGNLLGDEGSGYKIAIDAIKRMIFEEENSLPKSELTTRIMKRLGAKSIGEVVTFVYSSTKDEIASLAEIVSILGEEGNKIAEEILVNEGVDLAKTVINVYRKLKFESCSIALVGGVIRKAKILRKSFEKYLRENIVIEDIVDDEISPTIGAYYINKAKRESNV
ncbi:N-acetylglucosamine kinase [Clostridium beijerinckii]|uniref:N-acetylglucosamine kinase-like BadF-type ATPase n=1 Tax=Clostridium beijerinckii TaxID=1520 RepID=A0A1B9BL79_CLOBE|nr:BadF/BadG/BcrA/BcrD ATPase family protein [Clostridium beijerinckii]AQS07392.1 glucosamine kinase GspK [Clostridium beijerinckii]MBA2884546.1 N-acetylglucosamine kinase-like BadF-type ATPase [Clostridium beijerinckii]MBA2898084.1 N-acetylglucosamine kinase-like BadF-type ATPase [Clostridium beijerinckii]MBA2909935.1 N-acetylglucosamine kinase-like BadF-type ATPase [Clostridium beijerinckii]MBA9012975.1 N-acetylglucosamine kinase-like BadF-type ATPase [Clostridium beijerinckii]